MPAGSRQTRSEPQYANVPPGTGLVEVCEVLFGPATERSIVNGVVFVPAVGVTQPCPGAEAVGTLLPFTTVRPRRWPLSQMPNSVFMMHTPFVVFSTVHAHVGVEPE